MEFSRCLFLLTLVSQLRRLLLFFFFLENRFSSTTNIGADTDSAKLSIVTSDGREYDDGWSWWQLIFDLCECCHNPSCNQGVFIVLRVLVLP